MSGRVCTNCKKGFGPGVPVVKAVEKFFHKECLTCSSCKTNLVGKEFVEAGGSLQCDGCASKSQQKPVSVPCKTCGRMAEGTVVKAFGFTFHPTCMKCQVCSKPVNNDGFYDDDTDKILHLECLMKL
eukprot:m.287547 g.287547  ORF g.287547 m.287547 type:complete len:127 (-) comp22930_c0_seq1:31-411(-)